MTMDLIRAAYEAKPFRTFVMHLADGRAIPVHHREFIMAVPTGRTVIICQPDGVVNIVDVLLVTDLEMKAVTNGKRRKA